MIVRFVKMDLFNDVLESFVSFVDQKVIEKEFHVD